MLFAMIATLTSLSANAQEYADTTGLIEDIEAGIFEEYILAPASAEDTFFLSRIIYPSASFILKAKDDLGFMPVVTGNLEDRPSQFFRMKDIIGGADVEIQGIRFIGSLKGEKAVSDGLMRVLTEDINLTVKDCEFYEFQGYNTIAKVYNSGGDITLDNVLMVNTGGKIIQINYKDDEDPTTPNYVPKMGDLTITNTTSIDNYKRIFFELGAGDVPIDPNDPEIKQRFNAGAENITIDHCTFFRHEGVDFMQGRSLYEFGGVTAVEGTFTLTNTVFSAMDENLDPDSATQFIFDYSYYDFGLALAPEDVDDIDALFGATNTVVTAPVFADTTGGAWDLTLQNEADILGSDGTPIGDPRWWQQEWFPIGIENTVAEDIARVYSYRDLAVVETTEFHKGTVAFYSITGQMMGTRELVSQRTEIQLPAGLYIVRVSTNRGTMAAKIVCSD